MRRTEVRDPLDNHTRTAVPRTFRVSLSEIIQRIQSVRENIMNLLEEIKWRLFGEWRSIYTLAVIAFALLAVGGYVSYHFIHKYW
jgi:hypothetical protein